MPSDPQGMPAYNTNKLSTFIVFQLVTIALNVFAVPINEFIRTMGWLNFEIMRIEKDYCDELVKKAKKSEIGEAIGRDEELRRIEDILSRDNKGNVLLIGEPGVGKTQLAHGLAYNIFKGKVPEFFKNKKIYNVDFISLVAGKNFDYAAFQPTQRIKGLLNHAEKDENAILFIDEFHQTAKYVDYFKTAIDRGKVRILAATTYSEYQRYLAENEALVRRFEIIYVKELSPDVTFSILKNISKKVCAEKKVVISDENLKLIVQLCDEYIKNRKFPDKAIDIFNSVVKLVIRKDTDLTITEDDIKKTVSDVTGIPLGKYDNTEADIEALKANLKSKIFGQDEAIETACESLKLLRSNLKPENFVVSCLFVGGNSVGKRYLAKLIAEEVGNFIEVDMADYANSNSVVEFMRNEFNQNDFFKQLSQNPHSVILLKNVEKSSIEMIEMFEKALKNGYITDSSGKKFYISNSMVIATASVCDRILTSERVCNCKDCTDFYKKTVVKKCSDAMENLVVFNKLNKNDFKNIAKMFLDKFAEDFRKKNIILQFEEDVLEYLALNYQSYSDGTRGLFAKIMKDVITPAVKCIPDRQRRLSDKDLSLHCSVNSDKILVECD